MTLNAIIVSLLLLSMIIGFGTLVYGVFNTPVPYTINSDEKYFKIRVIGAILYIVPLIILAVFLLHQVRN